MSRSDHRSTHRKNDHGHPRPEPRKGAWEQVQVLEDPDSHVGLILSERIRGKPEYSFRIVHFDDRGPNSYVPLRPDGAKHALKDIVSSLVARAVEIIAEREAKELSKPDR